MLLRYSSALFALLAYSVNAQPTSKSPEVVAAPKQPDWSAGPGDGLARIGPFGTVNGQGIRDPSDQIPGTSIIITIACRGSTRLNYLEVNYLYDSGSPWIPISFGDPGAGRDQGIARLATGDRLTSFTPYICSDGWFTGDVCGIKFTFETRQPLLCGIDDSHGHAYVPSSLTHGSYSFSDGPFHTFFADTVDKGRVITKLGWSIRI